MPDRRDLIFCRYPHRLVYETLTRKALPWGVHTYVPPNDGKADAPVVQQTSVFADMMNLQRVMVAVYTFLPVTLIMLASEVTLSLASYQLLLDAPASHYWRQCHPT